MNQEDEIKHIPSDEQVYALFDFLQQWSSPKKENGVLIGQEEEIETPPEEQVDVLFDLLKQLPLPPLGRNDLCLCGSGLKYKKCCLTKNEKSTPSAIRTETFEIKTAALTSEESQNNFPAVSQEDNKLMETLYRTLRKHPEAVDSEDCEYFQKLNALRSKYPNNPIILNYIANGCDHLGQEDKLEKLITETYEKFPDYLFAQTAQAQLHLRDGFPEKAFEVLKGAHTLKQLYPHRSVFHITEVRAFEYFMVKYFCEIGDLEQAGHHLQILQKVLGENDAILQNAEKIFKKSRTLYKFNAGLSRLLSSVKK